MRRVITFGTFDIFHYGHLKILERAKSMGDHLTVGVSTDALNFSKKQCNPVYSQRDRIEIVQGIRYVNDAFFEESLEQKREYILHHRADVLVMGDDWKGKFDELSNLCEVIYLPRTEDISTTSIKAGIAS